MTSDEHVTRVNVAPTTEYGAAETKLCWSPSGRENNAPELETQYEARDLISGSGHLTFSGTDRCLTGNSDAVRAQSQEISEEQKAQTKYFSWNKKHTDEKPVSGTYINELLLSLLFLLSL